MYSIKDEMFSYRTSQEKKVFHLYENSSNMKLTSSPRQCDLYCKTELSKCLSEKFQQTAFFFLKHAVYGITLA